MQENGDHLLIPSWLYKMGQLKILCEGPRVPATRGLCCRIHWVHASSAIGTLGLPPQVLG